MHWTAALFADGLAVREVALMVPGLSAPAVEAMPGGGRAPDVKNSFIADRPSGGIHINYWHTLADLANFGPGG